MGHECKPVYVDKLGVSIEGNRTDITQMLDKNIPEKISLDGAFLRHLGMIKDFEQFSSRLWSVRAIEQNGIFVMNEIVSWLLASDKLASFTTLAKKGLPIPKTFVTEDAFAAYNSAKKMGEFVIKPIRGAMGFGVFRVNDPDFAMHVFGSFTSMNKPIYMQKYLRKGGNGDYRVVVVGESVLGAEFRKGRDWKSNIAQGGVASPTKADKEMREIAIKATKALALEFAGIDIAATSEGYMILDVNPTLSWQGFKKATKINVADALISHLVTKLKN